MFEVDPPSPNSSYLEAVEYKTLSPTDIQAQNPKWFGTFPYPYMNGSLHLGHAFTISKIEFATGFERMLGKRALFPMGFHLTGLPIKASADKIAREMELFGKDFSGFEAAQEKAAAAEAAAPAATTEEVAVKTEAADPSKGKKGKLAAKSTGLTYQFQILELLGIPRSEIHKFADPHHWGKHFPPIAKKDCTNFGARIDWRRSFTTTDINPYYDSFVRWQMNKLHAQGKIKFGKRYTIYSPMDGQPCMDHDRQSGEGVGPQEYTAVKMEVLEWSDKTPQAVKDAVKGKKVSMVAGTLRPETMYGQTNCFVGTPIEYGIFEVNDKEAYLITDRSARNMAYQGVWAWGETKKLASVKGADLIGTKVAPSFGVHKEVYVLPMEGVLPNKGTGVVTSVPSDSPDDYATLMDLRKKAEFYGIKPEWAAYDPIPVLETPKYGSLIAPALVTEMKIQSQKDKIKLTEAKDIAYKEGFNNGIMLMGDFKGLPVAEAKPKVRAQMIEQGLAFAYAEPENAVTSRSGDDCIVALCDQWYLNYGEEEWKQVAKTLVSRMDTYFPETRNQFDAVLDWLNQWACARSYGLGSKLPWDQQFLVESLSDSTIYMAYYTVSQLLHEGSIYGDKTGPLGITPDQMTDEVWEYVFAQGQIPEEAAIDREAAAHLKYSFNYFYPMDVRSSGKDLIPNHLTFCVYVHAALFPEHHWPKSMRANGHLMLNGKKMSKSTGNFLTLGDATEKFGADATRLTLADAGDEIDDANFEELTANAAILRLHTASDWATEMKQAKADGKLRTGDLHAHDKMFLVEMDVLSNRTKDGYRRTFYKDALKNGFYELSTARDWYRDVTLPENGGPGMHADVVFRFLRLLALLPQPLIPHFCEHIWRDVLGEKTSVQTAIWPETAADTPESEATLAQLQYMRGVLGSMRSAESQFTKKKGKGKAVAFDPSKPRAGRIYVALKFPQWQDTVANIIKEAYEEGNGQLDDKVVRSKLEQQGLGKDKKSMPFYQQFKVSPSRR